MEKIKVLFVQEKRARKNFPLLVECFENEAPDTYEMTDVGTKENIVAKLEEFKPHIVIIMQNSRNVNVYDIAQKIKNTFPQQIIFVSLLDTIGNQEKVIQDLKDVGVYKCYFSAMLIDTLIHDMYVALNRE